MGYRGAPEFLAVQIICQQQLLGVSNFEALIYYFGPTKSS